MHCLSPWFEMSLHCSGFGKVGCCAFAGRPFAFKSNGPFHIEELWNTTYFQSLRKAIGDKALNGSGCEDCSLAVSDKRADLKPVHSLNEKQASNFNSLIRSYENKDLIVDAYPGRYQFNFSSSCNIRCIMCNQQDARDSHFRDEHFSAAALLENKDILSFASSINISGGEPLCSSECKKFLTALCRDEELVDVELDLVSNGLLLPQIYDLLSLKDRLTLHVSLDGIGPVHEYVRKGSSWAKVESVINDLVSMKDRLGKESWRLGAEFILMKSTLPVLVDYIQFCLARQMTPGILHLRPTRDTEQEDLVRNPKLLSEIDGWDGILNKARELLDNAQEFDLVASIESYRKELHAAKADAPTKRSFYSQEISNNVLSNPEQVFGKRILIWGVGGNYRYCLSGWLKNNIHRFHFLGFTSNWEEHWGTTCDGHPVMSPKELRLVLPEVIIVAAQQIWRTEIIEQIRDMNFMDPIII